MSNKKIKVTHVARFAKPNIGGIESVIEQINDSLPNEKYEKEIFCCSNTEKSSVENGVIYNRFRYLFDYAANSISPHLFFGMIGLKTDILHFHMPVIQNVIIWFILYHLGLLKYKKMIITYHGAIVGYDKIMKPFWPLYKYFYKKADIIHVLSPIIIDSDEILSSYREKCVVIPFGISTKVKQDYDVQLINGYDINEFAKSGKKILCMGRMVFWKGFFVAVEAMKLLNNCVLFLAGKGPDYERIKEYIDKNNLKNKVLLLGNVTENENKEYLFCNVDIFVLPSIRKSESFGIVQVEAMKYSRPVINTSLGTGVNYVSVDKETGLTVEPNNVEQLANAINELVNNDELRFKYGKNARKRVEDLFNIEKIKEQYERLYHAAK